MKAILWPFLYSSAPRKKSLGRKAFLGTPQMRQQASVKIDVLLKTESQFSWFEAEYNSCGHTR